MTGLLVMVAALSLTVTKTVDLIRNLLHNMTVPKWVWNVVALGIGVVYCVGWQIDLSAAVLALIPALATNAERLAGVTGQILSGLIVGGGAGFFHELLDLWSSKAKAALPPLPPA